MSKTIINIDSTALGSATCERNLYYTIIGSIGPDGQSEGAYKSLFPASASYGVAVHKYIDLMYKTKGRIDVARDGAIKAFNRPKLPAPKTQQWLNDEKHLLTVCYNVWEEYCVKETSFQLLEIPVKCWSCEGEKIVHSNRKMVEAIDRTPDNNLVEFKDAGVVCPICEGKGYINGPSTELTFRILFYEDDYVQIYLCGTIDKLGKFVNGIYSIGDWKSTSQWDSEKYLEQYKLSRQLRVYRLACKLAAKDNPDTAHGKIGNTNIGGFIDGIFLTSKPNDVKVIRSQVFQFSDTDIDNFAATLTNQCKQLSCIIQESSKGRMTGILNGACTTIYGRCKFWNVCANDGPLGDMLLNRDFERKVYNPLTFGED